MAPFLVEPNVFQKNIVGSTENVMDNAYTLQILAMENVLIGCYSANIKQIVLLIRSAYTTMIHHTSVEIIAWRNRSLVMELAVTDGCLVIMITMAMSPYASRMELREVTTKFVMKHALIPGILVMENVLMVLTNVMTIVWKITDSVRTNAQMGGNSVEDTTARKKILQIVLTDLVGTGASVKTKHAMTHVLMACWLVETGIIRTQIDRSSAIMQSPSTSLVMESA